MAGGLTSALMARPALRPMTEDDLGGAARLLAARHGRHRVCEPLLDPRFEHLDVAADQVDSLLRSDQASGAVAVVGDEVVGYLLGAPRPGALWGPNLWVEPAGHALADDADAELVRDLYALAAERWAREGRTAHYVVAPSHDGRVLDAWWRLGFGQQHVHAIREVPVHATYPSTEGFTIRLAGPADIRALAGLDLVLDQHQLRSPVFSGLPPPSLETAVAEWVEGVDDPDLTTFVAERDGAVLGSAIGCSVARSGMHAGLCRPPEAALLGFAAVRPDAQGEGLGRGLGETVLAWAAGAGYRSVVTDWRATNLLSSRIWPRLGFRPTFLRLHRLIG
ncbi:MAG TPA: GNAT family N-acetyltransferase [Candidatus Limnocylindria bacterium]|nr:GNAT family N-acetyltransferase [Candidatus Limnocylindria bacterium]